MSSQGVEAPPPPSFLADPSPPSSLPSQNPTDPYLPPDLNTLSLHDLILHLQAAYAQIKIYDLKLRRLETSYNGQAAAQESRGNEAQNDEGLEHGRQPPPQVRPQMVRPAMRIHVPDTFGMRVEHPSDRMWSQGAGRRRNEEDGQDTNNVAPTLEWSSQRQVAVASMPDAQKVEVAMHALHDSQTALKETQEKLEKTQRMNDSLMTQLYAEKTACEEKADAERRLTEELAAKNRDLTNLKRQLQQLQTENNTQRLSLRPGIKRGRFLMSRASTLECSNCRGVFSSEEDAGNSLCSHHLKSACALPNKMMAEVFPEERSKYRYWPCCQQISTRMAPPCHHGVHDLHLL